MRAGTFTPTVVSAALDKHHRERLVLDEAAGTFSIEVESQDPLLSVDGNHRFEALGILAKQLDTELGKAEGDEERDRLKKWLTQLMNLPVTVVVYFDGDPAIDFVNLQKGKPVDASHLKSLALLTGLDKDPASKLAHETARVLNRDNRSPFREHVRFDSRGCKALPISSLTATGASDLATSLLGLARVGKAHNKDAKFLAAALTDAFQALEDKSTALPEGEGILEEGKLLTPVKNQGKKGSSTLLTGVGLCLAYRLVALSKDAADEVDLRRLVDAAEHTLNGTVEGNLSGPGKRELMRKFAREYFADLPGDRHQGVPVDLLRLLSCSAFGVDRLPKPPKPATAPKAAKPRSKKKATVAANVGGGRPP
jgi:hypothetical protein